MTLIISKLTGHPTTKKAASDSRYISETEPHVVPGTVKLQLGDVAALIGKPAKIFSVDISGSLKRYEAETMQKKSPTGAVRIIKTGIISKDYASAIEESIKSGKEFHIARTLPRGALQKETGYIMERNRGEVFPLTHYANIECEKAGISSCDTAHKKLLRCGQVMRAFLKGMNHSSLNLLMDD